ncbi:hypothetical protein [Lichenicoccus sp.]|uniref:hypothetical protein n=1 Tax=Lichenicoccus sp. TaxID=2781899 RepID=UPI003D0C9C7B
MKITLRCDPALEAALERRVPARHALPDWLKAMPMLAASDMHAGAEIRTVKQCPPFIDAMQCGIMMPLPCDLHYRDGVFTWDWSLPEPSLPGHPRAPISFHSAAQVTGAPFGSANLVKFIGHWTIALPPGWSLLATHPLNRDDLPFRTLTGLVDADAFNEIGLLFPARWLDAAMPGALPRGTPVAQLIPIRREPEELEFGTIDDARAAGFARVGEAVLSEPGIYRKQFRARER